MYRDIVFLSLILLGSLQGKSSIQVVCSPEDQPLKLLLHIIERKSVQWLDYENYVLNTITDNFIAGSVQDTQMRRPIGDGGSIVLGYLRSRRI